MKYIIAVGKRIEEILKEKNCNQKQLSEKCKISRITINRTIRARGKEVPFETLFEICKSLDITIKDFYHSELFNEDLEK